MPSPTEIEQARARVSVACLRWLRPEFEGMPPAGPDIARGRREAFRLDDPPDSTGSRGRDHPLWDRWIDG